MTYVDGGELDLPETTILGKPDAKPAFLQPGLTGRGGPYAQETELPEPTPDETMGAAFQLHNTVVNGIRWLSEPTFKPDPEFSGGKVLDIIKGTKYEADYLDNFLEVQSEAETRHIMARIDQEEKAREIIARSGWGGVIAAMVAGTLDPTVLVPIGGWIGTGIKAGRAGRLAVRAGEGAALAGGAIALQEGVLQGTKETRTGFESVVNIGGGAVLGAILGPVLIRGLPPAERIRLEKAIEAEMAVDDTFASTVPTGAGAQAVEATRGSGEQRGSFGVQKALRLLTPKSRTQTSESRMTRNTARDLVSGEALEENYTLGIASSEGGSVEARMGSALGTANDVFENNRRLYSKYYFGTDKGLPVARANLARVFGQSEGKLSFTAFRQAVSDAALANDQHVIPEVAEAAKYRRDKLVNPYRDEAMNTIPGFKEQVAASTADDSYLTRIWNRVAVKARFNELKAKFTAHFQKMQDEAQDRITELEMKSGAQAERPEVLSKQDFEDLAKDTINAILGQAPGRTFMPGDMVKINRGPLAERALRSLPTREVLEFVERDIEKIDNFYVRTMAADINLTKKFGSVDLKDQTQKISDEYDALKAGKSEKEQIRLQNAKEADIRDIMAMRDILRGTYKLPDNPDGLLHRSVVGLKTANFISSLGMMTVSSISDISKPIFIHGLTRNLRLLWHPFVGSLNAIKLARKDAKLANAGVDMIANDRALNMNELVDDYAKGTMVERGLTKAGQGFSFLTLMAPWNAFFKQFTGIIAITRSLQNIEAMVKGRISKAERGYLAQGGISENLADRIHKQFEKFGGKDGEVWFANTRDWTDKEAREALHAFINRDVNRVIVTPGAGDKPLWARGDLGSVIGQFQSFALASVQHTLVAGLQQRDAAAFTGMMLMLATGALSYKLKTNLAGRETSDNPAIWASEALDNSGLLGLLMNANHAIEKVTEDRLGISALTGEPARRYLNVNKIGAFLGPSFGRGSDVLDVIGAGFRKRKPDGSGGWSQSDTHKLRKMAPLQNLFYLRWLFDRMERGANQAFGVPMKRRRLQ